MGWLKKLFSDNGLAQRAPTEPPAGLAPVMLEGRSQVEVKGESQYQKALLSLAGGKKHEEAAHVEVAAALRREPTNRYDANAVQVLVDNRLVGYLRRDLAETYGPMLASMEAKGQEPTCRGVIMGGWDRGRDDEGSFGIFLRMPTPAAMKKQFDH